MTLKDQDAAIDVYSSGGELLDEIMCDMQPYSGELAQEEYGLEISCVKRIYTALNPNISEGAKVAESGKKPAYIVKYKEHWDDYTVALLALLPQAVQSDKVDNEKGTNSASDMYGGGFY